MGEIEAALLAWCDECVRLSILADRAARPEAKPVAWRLSEAMAGGYGYEEDYAEVRKWIETGDHGRWHLVEPLYSFPPADAMDAARYRWLQKDLGRLRQAYLDSNGTNFKLDAAIDAAMLETPTKEAT